MTIHPDPPHFSQPQCVAQIAAARGARRIELEPATVTHEAEVPATRRIAYGIETRAPRCQQPCADRDEHAISGEPHHAPPASCRISKRPASAAAANAWRIAAVY